MKKTMEGTAATTAKMDEVEERNEDATTTTTRPLEREVSQAPLVRTRRRSQDTEEEEEGQVSPGSPGSPYAGSPCALPGQGGGGGGGGTHWLNSDSYHGPHTPGVNFLSTYFFLYDSPNQ